DRTTAMLAHLLGAAGYLLSVGVLSWLGPLLIYLLKREQSRFVAFHALQSLAFQLGWIAIIAIGWWVTHVLMWVLIGFLLLPIMALLFLVPLIWSVYAGIQASNGLWYEYPVAGAWARRMVGV